MTIYRIGHPRPIVKMCAHIAFPGPAWYTVSVYLYLSLPCGAFDVWIPKEDLMMKDELRRLLSLALCVALLMTCVPLSLADEDIATPTELSEGTEEDGAVPETSEDEEETEATSQEGDGAAAPEEEEDTAEQPEPTDPAEEDDPEAATDDEEQPAPLTEGYASVKGGTAVYDDSACRERLGAFTGDSVVYVLSRDDDRGVLSVVFAAEGEAVRGYVSADACEALSESRADAASRSEDAAWQGHALPNAAYAPVVSEPAEEEQPSTEEEQPSTEEEQPSAEKEQPATEEEQPSAEEQPSTEEEQPSTEEEQTSTEEEQLSTEEEQPTNEEEQPSAEEDLATATDLTSRDDPWDAAPEVKWSVDLAHSRVELSWTGSASNYQVVEKNSRGKEVAVTFSEKPGIVGGLWECAIEASVGKHTYIVYPVAEDGTLGNGTTVTVQAALFSLSAAQSTSRSGAVVFTWKVSGLSFHHFRVTRVDDTMADVETIREGLGSSTRTYTTPADTIATGEALRFRIYGYYSADEETCESAETTITLGDEFWKIPPTVTVKQTGAGDTGLTITWKRVASAAPDAWVLRILDESGDPVLETSVTARTLKYVTDPLPDDCLYQIAVTPVRTVDGEVVFGVPGTASFEPSVLWSDESAEAELKAAQNYKLQSTVTLTLAVPKGGYMAPYYDLYDDGAYVTQLKGGKYTATSISWSLTGQADGTHVYYVVPCNANRSAMGYGSNEAALTVTSEAWEYAPLSLSAKEQSNTSNNVDLSWKKNAVVPDGYAVFMDGEEVGRTAASGVYKYTVESVEAGTHTFTVYPVQDGQVGRQGITVSLLVKDLWSAAALKVKASAIAANSTQYKVSWSKGASVLPEKWIVRAWDANDDLVWEDETANGKTYTLTTDALIPGTYAFTVTPSFEGREGETSAPATATTAIVWDGGAGKPSVTAAQYTKANSCVVLTVAMAKGYMAPYYAVYDNGELINDYAGGKVTATSLTITLADQDEFSDHVYTVLPVSGSGHTVAGTASEPVTFAASDFVHRWDVAPASLKAAYANKNTGTVKLTWKAGGLAPDSYLITVYDLDAVVNKSAEEPAAESVMYWRGETTGLTWTSEPLESGPYRFEVAPVCDGRVSRESAVDFTVTVGWREAPTITQVGQLHSAAEAKSCGFTTTLTDAAFDGTDGYALYIKWTPAGTWSGATPTVFVDDEPAVSALAYNATSAIIPLPVDAARTEVRLTVQYGSASAQLSGTPAETSFTVKPAIAFPPKSVNVEQVEEGAVRFTITGSALQQAALADGSLDWSIGYRRAADEEMTHVLYSQLEDGVLTGLSVDTYSFSVSALCQGGERSDVSTGADCALIEWWSRKPVITGRQYGLGSAALTVSNASLGATYLPQEYVSYKWQDVSDYEVVSIDDTTAMVLIYDISKTGTHRYRVMPVQASTGEVKTTASSDYVNVSMVATPAWLQAPAGLTAAADGLTVTLSWTPANAQCASFDVVEGDVLLAEGITPVDGTCSVTLDLDSLALPEGGTYDKTKIHGSHTFSVYTTYTMDGLTSDYRE